MNLAQKNIENLTSVWRIVGERANAYTSGKTFDYCMVSDAEWPNRLWFHKDLTEEGVKLAKEKLRSQPSRLVIPYWDIYQSESYHLLEQNGFEKLSDQIGMAMQLPTSYQQVNSLSIQKVNDTQSAELWVELFRKAFHYQINHRLLLQSHDVIDYLIAYHEGQAVGTGLLHYSEDHVVGIHAMGIVPEMRRKGYAEQMMHHMLAEAVEKGYRYATLQASAMGKGLYLKLGFEEQFRQFNYTLNIEGSMP